MIDSSFTLPFHLLLTHGTACPIRQSLPRFEQQGLSNGICCLGSLFSRIFQKGTFILSLFTILHSYIRNSLIFLFIQTVLCLINGSWFALKQRDMSLDIYSFFFLQVIHVTPFEVFFQYVYLQKFSIKEIYYVLHFFYFA